MVKRQGIKEMMEEADVTEGYNLPSLEEFTKMVKELLNEKPNNTRK